jgi:hypothetical protein
MCLSTGPQRVREEKKTIMLQPGCSSISLRPHACLPSLQIGPANRSLIFLPSFSKKNRHFLTRPLRLAPPLHPALLGRSNAIAARPADPIGYVLSAAASVLEQPTVSGVA